MAIFYINVQWKCGFSLVETVNFVSLTGMYQLLVIDIVSPLMLLVLSKMLFSFSLSPSYLLGYICIFISVAWNK